MEAQQFASNPQAVQHRGKYRDDEPGMRNIMHDRRVVRGNTYASLVMPQQDMAEIQKQREAQRRRIMRANQTKKRVGTPEPVIGRKHIDIQTDSYLEELTERTVEFEAETQTDFLLDRPPSPLFMPAKVGVDVDTQVLEGELFDFDQEVEPVLEVLVGKTLEQSMMEVLEEEELQSIQRHQEEFEQLRNAELLEVQRMEAAEKRRADEMERRMQQMKAKREQNDTIMRKVLSRSIARGYLGGLKEKTMQHLLDSGFFQDSVQVAVEGQFMPWLMENIQATLAQERVNQQLADDVLQSAINGKVQAHAAAIAVEKARLEAIEEAARRAKEEAEEEKRVAEMEAKRILEEQERMKAFEEMAAAASGGDPNATVVLSFDDEGLKLADGSEGITVPDDQKDALLAALGGLAEGQAVLATLNRDEKVLASFQILNADGSVIGADADAAPAADAPAEDA